MWFLGKIQCFQGNNKQRPQNQCNLNFNRIRFDEKTQIPIYETKWNTANQIYKNEKNLYAKLRLNRQNFLRHTFCTITLNGLRHSPSID